MEKVKTIKVLPLAVFQAILTAHLGLLAGILYSFGGTIYDLVSTGSVNLGTALAFFALIGMPIVFAVSGFVLGLIEGFLFNLFSKWSGGARINFIS